MDPFMKHAHSSRSNMLPQTRLTPIGWGLSDGMIAIEIEKLAAPRPMTDDRP